MLEAQKEIVDKSWWKQALCDWNVGFLPELLCRLEMRMEFIVMQNVLVDLVIGRPNLKTTSLVKHFKTEDCSNDYGGQ